ncbi:-tyrosine-phosphatase MKP1 [Olea europaea subsp. europaea]|uniref:-tyrosine-phosphatase MKP1 n=1 Tax=Olea europaea subsp. europaea TaxID=158383 RepID=A0A8S0VAI8_OLEEU|nr:-tyrosine-phosphatase MKP1 [Olea europaea subsp. europaea]
MLEKEESTGATADNSESSQGPCQVSGGRKFYWRSASWSSSRTSLPPINPDTDNKDGLNLIGNNNSNCGVGQRIPPPLTPRTQHSFKGRSCLPPLAIARRSLDEWPKAGSDDIGEWPLITTPGGRSSTGCGERLKLDLSNIQKNPDSNVCGLVKREKIAFFDKECSKVAEHIYLGGDAVARDREILKQHGITHILNCVGFVCPEYFKADFVYKTLWLQDNPSEDITSILYDVFDYFEYVREQGGRVFVHCCQGVSRSTSLVIAYLMWREGQSFDDAFRYVKAARGIADPNMGFACQLLQCQKRVHAFPLSPSSLLRMYRMAPHSPYDPLHLVPKMLNDPSTSALDSRGAFIIHAPSTIYVWIGKSCEAIMERDARGAVCQIVRYEKVQCPIVVIKEGQEPSYFWDAFSNLLPLMDTSSNGVCIAGSTTKIPTRERLVDSYDVEFEIFRKATIGGFVPPSASSEAEHETHLPVRESCWSVLRCKFVSGNMEEFVSASKSGISRIYPDSPSIFDSHCAAKQIQSSANSLLSSKSLSFSSSSPSSMSLSSSPSFSSPHYFSPDSISPDSSNSSTYFLDSPATSPLALSCNNVTSACLSSFSNISLHSSKFSPHSVSKSSKYIDVNFKSQPFSHAGSSPSKKLPLSIAERRGSLSKCLKLPLQADNSQEKDAPSSGLINEYDVVSANGDAFSLNELHNREEAMQHEGERRENIVNGLLLSSGGGATVNSCHEKVSLLKHSNKLCERPLGEKEAGLLDIMIDGISSSSNSMKPVVCRWPSLERLVSVGTYGLDSKSVFLLITPNSGSGKVEDSILYVWVGRSFSCDGTEMTLGSQNSSDSLEEIDWIRASSDVLSQMGLPEDIKIEFYIFAWL